jgi:hypothetical protein
VSRIVAVGDLGQLFGLAAMSGGVWCQFGRRIYASKDDCPMNLIDQRLSIFVQNAANLASQFSDLQNLREQVRKAELNLRRRSKSAATKIQPRGARYARASAFARAR